MLKSLVLVFGQVLANTISCELVEQKKRNSDGIEQDLAKARAAIREAIVLKSFKSEKESFVPRGSVYKNAYAFHQ